MEFPQDNDTMPLKDGFNFTPLFQGQRVRMRVAPKTLEAIGRGEGYKGMVQDLDTQKVYSVYGRPCGVPHCYCDAEIVEVRSCSRVGW